MSLGALVAQCLCWQRKDGRHLKDQLTAQFDLRSYSTHKIGRHSCPRGVGDYTTVTFLEKWALSPEMPIKEKLKMHVLVEGYH